MTQFGVYPVTAQLSSQGGVLDLDQTLLPFWPGSQAAGLTRPLDIAWVWPLIDQPHHRVCAALSNNDLAASLGPGGRLSALLTAGQAYPGADLTWVIDPALLSDVATMTRPTRWLPGPAAAPRPTSRPARRPGHGCQRSGRSPRPADGDHAVRQRGRLRARAQRADRGYASAYAMGETVADSVLHGSFGSSIALPAGGTADLSVLTNLATAQHIGTVVLDSSEMPPTNPAVFSGQRGQHRSVPQTA